MIIIRVIIIRNFFDGCNRGLEGRRDALVVQRAFVCRLSLPDALLLLIIRIPFRGDDGEGRRKTTVEP